MTLSRDPESTREWKRRSEKRRREKVKREVLAKERPWNSLNGARKRRLRSVNPERRERRWQEAFGSEARVEWVRKQPCEVCGERPSENAHVRSRGAGGTHEDVVPLCAPHHRQQHDIGIRSFSELHHIDLARAARETHARWLEERGGNGGTE